MQNPTSKAQPVTFGKPQNSGVMPGIPSMNALKPNVPTMPPKPAATPPSAQRSVKCRNGCHA
jgi:hypothetical protein